MPNAMIKTCIALLATGTACAAAQATDILLQQTPAGSGSGVISTGARPTYDDFRLAGDSEITSLTWWATSFSDMSGAFRISFTGVANGSYADVANPIYSATVNATGVASGGRVRFDVDLPTAAILPGSTNLFLSIADVSPGAFYFWAMGNAAPSPGSLPPGISLTYNSPTPTLQGLDAAWALNGTRYVAPVEGVPEPAAWAMMTIGFGLVGGSLRRRRTRIAFG